MIENKKIITLMNIMQNLLKKHGILRKNMDDELVDEAVNCVMDLFNPSNPAKDWLKTYALDAPWPTLKELMDKVADLSLKLNVMQSSLREFEKEKVEPIREKIGSLGNLLRNELYEISQRIGDNFRIHKRAIDDFETDTMSTNETIKSLLQRIDILEKQVEQLRYEKLMCDKCDSVKDNEIVQSNTGDIY